MEIPYVIQRLLTRFSNNPLEAREILLEHKQSNEAVEIKKLSDPITEFCSYFHTTADTNGLFVGNANSKDWRRGLYKAYLEFLKANNLGYYTLSLPLFTRAMEQGIRQNQCLFDYRRMKKNSGMQTNVHFNDVEEFSVLFIK